MTEFDFYKTLLEYCKAILNAETEEEVEAIREEISQVLKKEWNYDDIAVKQFMTILDKWIEQFEQDESLIDEVAREIDSMAAQYVSTDDVAQVIDTMETRLEENTESAAIQTVTPNILPVSTQISAGIGIALAIFASCFVIRKKSKKNEKKKCLKR